MLLKIENIVKADGKICLESSFIRTPIVLGKETLPEALWTNSGEFYQIPEGISTFE